MTENYVSRMFKFSGAGNDFVVLDGRKGGMEPFREAARIGELCREHHTDGLMILTEGEGTDFTMEFYNPDGSGGMMCGNGGRCIVAFADYLGIRPADGHTYRFLAPDGLHEAVILEGTASGGTPFAPLSPAPPIVSCVPFGNLSPTGPSPCPSPGVDKSPGGSSLQKWTVRLKMIDVKGITPVKGGYFLNTGTRHFVKFVDSVETLDMEADAKPLRWDPAFQPEGTNVNLVQETPEGLKVRTFEKGVPGRWSPRPHLRERRGRGDPGLRHRPHGIGPGGLSCRHCRNGAGGESVLSSAMPPGRLAAGGFPGASGQPVHGCLSHRTGRTGKNKFYIFVKK